MTRNNCTRKGCKDVWDAFLVSSARYSGVFEFPEIQPTSLVPNRLIAFSKAVRSSDFDQWVHFYEDDHLFERVWRDPKAWLSRFRRFNGIILPDFSVYRDMPLAMQIWNIYRSRALGHWYQMNGVNVIANIRWGDYRTQGFCCDGIAENSVIAIGSHGNLKCAEDRRHFSSGLEVVVARLRPSVLVVYGAAPDSIFGEYRDGGIDILQFESECAIAHRRAV